MRAIGLAMTLWLAASPAVAAGFSVTSESLHDGAAVSAAQVFNGDGCTGGNISPQLSWSGVPRGTGSFGVTLFDPDARGGRGWWHWAAFDIPARARGLAGNAGGATSSALPAGAAQGRNDFGLSGYSGPCPPIGDKPHHYVITVYALRVARLELKAGVPDAAVATALQRDAIASARLVATYGRQR